MQSKNAIVIAQTMAGMCGMYKLYVCYLEHRCWTCIEVQYATYSAYMEDVGHLL